MQQIIGLIRYVIFNIRLREYSLVNLSSLVLDDEWTTVVNLGSENKRIKMSNQLKSLNRCCPEVRQILDYYNKLITMFNYIQEYQYDTDANYKSSIERVRCDISKEEFKRDYIDKQIPALLVGCNYDYLDNIDLSAESVAMVSCDFYIWPISLSKHVNNQWVSTLRCLLAQIHLTTLNH